MPQKVGGGVLAEIVIFFSLLSTTKDSVVDPGEAPGLPIIFRPN